MGSARRTTRLTARVAVVALGASLITAVAGPSPATAGAPGVGLPDIPSVAVSSGGMQARPVDPATQNALSGNQSTAGGSADGGGSSTATPLSASASWNVSTQTGDFAWSYPMPVPQVPGGLTPSLSLSYRSSAVDGLTSATNNQASWVGDGWNLGVGFIQRAYGPCSADTAGGTTPPKTGDMCWRSDNAVSATGGVLIKVDETTFRFQQDDGSRVQRLTGAGNGDNNGEYWKVTTLDGTQYFYGSRPTSSSTWTVPVYGDDAGEPCNGSSFAASSCTQAWRWNLDKVVDPRGNAIVYSYATETNSYGQNLQNAAVSYIRGGTLLKAEYGLRDDLPGQALGVVDFVTADRCVRGSTCTAAQPANWPDVPWTDKCDTATCAGKHSPTFWSTKMLTKVIARTWNGTALVDVDSWALDQQFPTTGDGERPALWLRSVQHTGHAAATAGAAAIALPPVVFEGRPMANRVDTVSGMGPLMRYRVTAVVAESGGVTEIAYAAPNCVPGTSMPANPETNTLRCFPAKWAKKDFTERTDYFHKYVVDTVTATDRVLAGQVLANPRQVTRYEYLDGAAWHRDTSEFTKDTDKTWDEYRGYGRVRTHKGTADDASPITMTEQRFYRGMNGDKLPTGTRSATVTDSAGTARVDEDWLQGIEYESQQHLGQSETVVSKAFSTPTWQGPTATRDSLKSYVVGVGSQEAWTALGAGWRKTRTEFGYDTYGQVTRVSSLGDTQVAGDETCSTTTYGYNTTKWLISYATRVETVSVGCGVTPVFPVDALSDSRFAYDGADFGAVPATGNVTQVQGLREHAAGAPTTYTASTEATYDRYGRPLTFKDPKGARSTIAYTPADGGPVTQVKSTGELGLASTTTFHPVRGLITKTVGARSEITETDFDALGRTTQVWLPNRPRARNSASVKYAYTVRNDSPSAVTTSAITPSGLYTVSTSILDGLYRERQHQVPTDGGRLLTDTRYDSQGRAYKRTQPYFNSGAVDTTLSVGSDVDIPGLTFTEFDGVGREVASIYKSGSTERWRTTTAYEGDRVHVTPPQGATPITTVMDALGRTTESRQYRGTTPTGAYDATTYTYGKNGLLATMRNPAGTEWRWFYDARGNVVRKEDPDSGTATTAYNAVNQVESSTDGRNQTLAYKYDLLGRTTEVRQGSLTGALRQQFTYDTAVNGKGLPAAATRFVDGNAYTTQVDSYTTMGQISKASVVVPASEGPLQGTYTSDYGYTFDGQVASETMPAVTAANVARESVVNNFDALGRASFSNAGVDDIVSSTLYTKYGEEQRVEIGDPALHNRAWITSIYESDTRRLRRSIVDTETAGPSQADVNYTRDAAGNILSITDQPQGGTVDRQCFRYDHLQRLTEAWTPNADCAQNPSASALTGPAPYWNSYTYDLSGNRTKEIGHTAAGDTTRTYNYTDPTKPHRLSTVSVSTPAGATSTDSFRYDAVGNTTGRTAGGRDQTLDWDVEGKLAKVTEGPKVSTTIYTTGGVRLLRKDADSTTLYLGDQEVRLAAGSMTPTVTRYYRHNGTVVAMRQGGKLTWLAGDHQGSASIAVDSSSMTVSKRWQLPFGGSRGTAVPALAGERGFVGGTNDPSGLVHIGAREYDSANGRFVSVDPLLDLTDPVSWTGYAYAGNSPVTASDPTGLIADYDNPGQEIRYGGKPNVTGVVMSGGPKLTFVNSVNPLANSGHGPYKRGLYHNFNTKSWESYDVRIDIYSVEGNCNAIPGGVGPVLDCTGQYIGIPRSQLHEIFPCGSPAVPRCPDSFSQAPKAPEPLTVKDVLEFFVGEYVECGKDFGFTSACGMALLNTAMPPLGKAAKIAKVAEEGIEVGVDAARVAKGTKAAKAAEEAAESTPMPRKFKGPNGEDLPGGMGPGELSDTGKGLIYHIPPGTPGVDPKVFYVRVMEPVTKGKYQYPNGYVSYLNKMRDPIHPLTGNSIPTSHPYRHIPIEGGS
ncbi:RHS repeat-associated core domain-containing protein [Actinokineospora cianjurensis]|uniref:RHS repeat-associated protein n=1 Tax=Actinokineospora cianjurensis TaxID=585224 RepID=A0A421B6D9_9PSEU|nr:RHS repeat-associated core domain-containing protein [Actinokineospora cianjurensis]RLK60072.1 RHS repeat-associated protein [Actinokineospora cianjurensis]